MAGSAQEATELRSLLEQLQDPERQSPVVSPVAMFVDASARNRVGVVITRAVLGDRYERYCLYCGDCAPPV